jgi:hypothetical protein
VPANFWNALTSGNGIFVAVPFVKTEQVMTSPNGIDWTSRTSTSANQWWSVVYGNDVYVAVSDDGRNRVMTSPIGETWTSLVP